MAASMDGMTVELLVGWRAFEMAAQMAVWLAERMVFVKAGLMAVLLAGQSADVMVGRTVF